jgi:hypothetical protein
MATHNQVREIGYLLSDPKVLNEGKIGEEKIILKMRTARRTVDGYNGEQYADLLVYYAGDEIMEKLKAYKQFDIIDIKGVFNIIPTRKKSVCPCCGAINYKTNSVSTFVYPISATRLGSYKDYFEEKQESPDAFLYKNYRENSNQCLIIGTVVTEPELIVNKKVHLCRYGLGVNRKYFIKEQKNEHSDYPWVYSYGEQADTDFRYLKKGSLILVDGFIHNENAMTRMKCEACDSDYTFPDVGTQFTPYSIEYLNDYKSEEDVQKEEALNRLKMASEL